MSSRMAKIRERIMSDDMAMTIGNMVEVDAADYFDFCAYLLTEVNTAEATLKAIGELPKYRIRRRSERYPEGQWWECAETGEWIAGDELEAILENNDV